MNILENTLNITKFLSGQGGAIPLFKVFMPEEAIKASEAVLRSRERQRRREDEGMAGDHGKPEHHGRQSDVDAPG